MDNQTPFKLPFSNPKEFVEWARAAVARKQAVVDQIQRDYDEYVAKCNSRVL